MAYNRQKNWFELNSYPLWCWEIIYQVNSTIIIKLPLCFTLTFIDNEKYFTFNLLMEQMELNSLIG